MDTSFVPLDKDLTLRTIGIHLAGANTRKSALVRGSMAATRVLSGLKEGSAEHEMFAKSMKSFVGLLPIFAGDPEDDLPGAHVSPFFWEAFSTGVGPSSHRDSDSRLLEVIEDLDGADVFCIDAPLTLPPSLACPFPEEAEGTSAAGREVALMRQEWENRRAQERKGRSPKPYVDRYFEIFARNYFENFQLHALTGSEFEPAMSANRAPLTARGVWVAKELRRRYPRAVILETNASVSVLGWASAVGFQTLDLVQLKHGVEGQSVRARMLKRLEGERIATRSASLHEDLGAELYTHLELFYASLSALAVWGLVNGRILMRPEFLTLTPQQPLSGWACIPKDVERFFDRH